MSIIRRVLGILVMIAGILGLVISLAGLVMTWVAKPTVEAYSNSTFATLNTSVTTSQDAMVVADEAMTAAIDGVDALSNMLGTSAASLEDTLPVINQLNVIMTDTLPSTLQSTTDSLVTAQQAAVVLDSAIKSLENFRVVLSATPLIGSMVQLPEQDYNPEIPLADSLGAMASELETLPGTFTKMSSDMSDLDDKLITVKDDLVTMSESVAAISQSLSAYQTMLGKSRTSMDDLRATLTNIQGNLTNILNGVAIVLTLFFAWLLAAQVVILSQGWELFQGTADRMEGGDSDEEEKDKE